MALISLCDSAADQHFLYLYLNLAKTSFHTCGSYVSAAIYCRGNLYTWFININDNQHKGATVQLIDACSLV